MENKKTKLLQALRNSGAEKINEAYNWLQEHRHEFNKEVYGPVLLEVQMFRYYFVYYFTDIMLTVSFFSCE